MQMYQEEWKLVYEMYYKPLYLYALSLTRNQQDAEDLIQETFVKAYLSYEADGSLKYWLITVLRNEYFNLQRKRKKELLDDGQILVAQTSSEQDVLVRLVEQEERRRLFWEVQQLPPRMKEILMESVYFRMQDEEIGKLHQISKENVRKIRSRARQRLIQNMKEGNENEELG